MLGRFISAMAGTHAIAVGALLLAGWAMDAAYLAPSGETFFSYRLRVANDFPYWFASILLLMGVNGVYLFRLGTLEGGIGTPHGGGWGNYRIVVPVNPLRLLATNLVAIPLLLFLSVVVRQHGW